LSLIAIWGSLFFINLKYSRDVNEYTRWFNEARSLVFIDQFASIDWVRDPAYFFLQSVGTQLISFPVYLGAIIILISYICAVRPNIKFYMVKSYTFLL
jgi:hypothetical protein